MVVVKEWPASVHVPPRYPCPAHEQRCILALPLVCSQCAGNVLFDQHCKSSAAMMCSRMGCSTCRHASAHVTLPGTWLASSSPLISCVQGFTRYDAMIRLTRPIRYTHLRSCGHLTFVGAPLAVDTVVIGAPEVTLWVESSDGDADIFVYLEDEDPVTGKARSAGIQVPASLISTVISALIVLSASFVVA